MVKMHLLTVNSDFRYDPLYALGVVTLYDRFMQGYRPEKDKESIFQAVCKSVGHDPQQYRQDAERLSAIAASLSGEQLITALSSETPIQGAEELQQLREAIASNPKYKYSDLFAIGLYTLLEQSNADLVKDQKQRQEALAKIGDGLHLPQEKMEKDLELYRANLEKMIQARNAIEDAIKADRKQREKRELEKKAALE